MMWFLSKPETQRTVKVVGLQLVLPAHHVKDVWASHRSSTGCEGDLAFPVWKGKKTPTTKRLRAKVVHHRQDLREDLGEHHQNTMHCRGPREMPLKALWMARRTR